MHTHHLCTSKKDPTQWEPFFLPSNNPSIRLHLPIRLYSSLILPSLLHPSTTNSGRWALPAIPISEWSSITKDNRTSSRKSTHRLFFQLFPNYSQINTQIPSIRSPNFRPPLSFVPRNKSRLGRRHRSPSHLRRRLTLSWCWAPAWRTCCYRKTTNWSTVTLPPPTSSMKNSHKTWSGIWTKRDFLNSSHHLLFKGQTQWVWIVWGILGQASRESAAESSTGLFLLVLQTLWQAIDGLWGVIDPFQHFPGQQFKGLSNIFCAEGGDFSEVQFVLFGQVVSLLKGDSSLVHLVRLIADDESIDSFAGIPACQLGYLSISCSQKRSPSKDYRSVTS